MLLTAVLVVQGASWGAKFCGQLFEENCTPHALESSMKALRSPVAAGVCICVNFAPSFPCVFDEGTFIA